MLRISSYPDESTVVSFQSIDNFTLTYDISWDSVPIYGRQDPIQSYKSTGQTVSFSAPFRPDQNEPGTKKFIKSMDWLVKNLNKMLRPTYDNGIINQSPLLKVELGGAENPFYGKSGFILAASSVSLDYGERGRLIQQMMESHNPGFGAGIDMGANSVIPQKILVSFSGPIINIETVYKPASSASPTDPSTTTPSPQADANTGWVLDFDWRRMSTPKKD